MSEMHKLLVFCCRFRKKKKKVFFFPRVDFCPFCGVSLDEEIDEHQDKI